MSISPTLRKAKLVSASVVYGLVSFALVGVTIAILGEDHVSAVLVGWVLSLFAVTYLLKARM